MTKSSTSTTMPMTKYHKDLKRLVDTGMLVRVSFIAEHMPEDYGKLFKGENQLKLEDLPRFTTVYQSWYSEALVLIRLVLPDRLVDFEQHYKKPKTRKEISYESYRIEDALQGLMLKNGLGDIKVRTSAALPHLEQQLAILKSVERRFDSSLFEIRQLLQAELFDSEIEAAGELLKRGFTRAAGAVAGVVLERHLGEVAASHKYQTRKAHATISDYNEILKKEGLLDVPTWRFIQRLGDLRNLCDHDKGREPSKEEGEELIAGVERITKTVY